MRHSHEKLTSILLTHVALFLSQSRFDKVMAVHKEDIIELIRINNIFGYVIKQKSNDHCDLMNGCPSPSSIYYVCRRL